MLKCSNIEIPLCIELIVDIFARVQRLPFIVNLGISFQLHLLVGQLDRFEIQHWIPKRAKTRLLPDLLAKHLCSESSQHWNYLQQLVESGEKVNISQNQVTAQVLFLH